ncbi:MAG: DUF3105 domain-containing protein [Actinobacteria bacterium]|nr:DUF3105 domain-containing protein [Actinomycetota bacterium]
MGEVEEPRPARLRTALGRLGLAVVAVTVIGLTSGYLFGTANPEGAAGARISAFVRVEPADVPPEELEARDPAAPSTGEARGEAGCGERTEPLPADEQVAALAAGRVLLQYRPGDVDAAELAELRAIAGDHAGDVLLAPNPDLEVPFTATAWARRMPLGGPEPDLVDAFATAHAGGGPAPAPCDD